MTQSSPIASTYNTFSISGNTLTLPSPTFLLSSANSTSSNGITTGNLSYGESNIVLFGFGVTSIGTTETVTSFNIGTSGSENLYFANGRLYRSTTPVFPGGTPLYTSSAVSIAGGGNIACTVSETIPSGTTYYYWLVADYSVATSSNSTFSCNFTSGQGQAALIAPSPSYLTYNTYNIMGNVFNLVSTEYWTGGTSTDFGVAGNFTALNGGLGSVPTSTMTVNIGGHSYTNAPSILATTTIGGLSFSTTSAAQTLTIASGKTLTVNNALVVTGSKGATISGTTSSGTLTLASTAVSNVQASSALNLSGGVTMNNAGTFTVASTAALNLTGNSKVANTGTFTLVSDVSGSASIGQITGTSSITGTYLVQRYITGGSGARGYRLLSSPVYASAVSPNNVYSINYVANSCYITGTTVTSSGPGIDKAGAPTLYLFRGEHNSLTNVIYRWEF